MPDERISFSSIDEREWFVHPSDGVCCKFHLRVIDDRAVNYFRLDDAGFGYARADALVRPAIQPFHPQSRHQRAHFCNVCERVRP